MATDGGNGGAGWTQIEQGGAGWRFSLPSLPAGKIYRIDSISLEQPSYTTPGAGVALVYTDCLPEDVLIEGASHEHRIVFASEQRATPGHATYELGIPVREVRIESISEYLFEHVCINYAVIDEADAGGRVAVQAGVDGDWDHRILPELLGVSYVLHHAHAGPVANAQRVFLGYFSAIGYDQETGKTNISAGVNNDANMFPWPLGDAETIAGTPVTASAWKDGSWPSAALTLVATVRA